MNKLSCNVLIYHSNVIARHSNKIILGIDLRGTRIYRSDHEDEIKFQSFKLVIIEKVSEFGGSEILSQSLFT